MQIGLLLVFVASRLTLIVFVDATFAKESFLLVFGFVGYITCFAMCSSKILYDFFSSQKNRTIQPSLFIKCRLKHVPLKPVTQLLIDTY